MYNLTEVVNKVKAAAWYEKPEGAISFKGSVIVGIELQDSNRRQTLQCSIFANNTLGTGDTFEEAFIDLEKQLGEVKEITSEVVATV